MINTCWCSIDNCFINRKYSHVNDLYINIDGNIDDR